MNEFIQHTINGLAQFNLPGSNGLVFQPARNVQDLATDFIFRFFPASKNQVVLNTTELATIFHLPDAALESATQVERKGIKEVSAPANLPEAGLVLGSNFYGGQEKVVRLT